jgi:hypothetical protein
MYKKMLTKIPIRVTAIAGISCCSTTICLAAAPAIDPDLINKVSGDASINPWLGAMTFFTIMAFACMAFAYKQLQTITALANNNAELNASLRRLADNLNERPCIHVKKIVKIEE